MKRPLFYETMMELTARAARNQHAAAELELLRSELMHRKTQAAHRLLASVRQPQRAHLDL